MTCCTPPTRAILLTRGGGAREARGVAVFCREDEGEDDDDETEQDRRGVVKFMSADLLVRGGGFGNNSISIESFLLDVEVDKFAADKVVEQVDESDATVVPAAVGSFLLSSGGGE